MCACVWLEISCAGYVWQIRPCLPDPFEPAAGKLGFEHAHGEASNVHPTALLQGTSEYKLYTILHLLKNGNMFILANTKVRRASQCQRQRRASWLSMFFSSEPGWPQRPCSSPILPQGRAWLIPMRARCVSQPVVAPASRHVRILQQLSNTSASQSSPYRASSFTLPLNAATNYSTTKMVCGGGYPVTATCGSLRVDDPSGSPPRTMFNTILLSVGKVLFISGASSGYADYSTAGTPASNSYLLNAAVSPGSAAKFDVLSPSTIARPFQASATLAHDGRDILAGGSPTRSPRQPSTRGPCNCLWRPSRHSRLCYADRPRRSTHGLTMSQRIVKEQFTKFFANSKGRFSTTVSLPPNCNIAPPGQYLLFEIVKPGRVGAAVVPAIGGLVQLGGIPAYPPPPPSPPPSPQPPSSQ
eukprot:SM000123S25848  [mRNA]  locus=s123:245418:247050:- [translate_table: standard]